MGFDWDEANTAHIARHGVSRDDAEAVFYNAPRELEGRTVNGEARQTIIGPTDAGSLLVVVWTIREGTVRVVTAYPAKAKLRRWYAEKG